MASDRDRKLHFVGAGGAGMSGLALAMLALGAEVSGSDRERSSYTERLVAAGAAISIGHDAANVPNGAELVVSTAIAGDNPELARARELGLTVLHRSDLLAELAGRKRCIAVAGTHGKTTTTAMIAHIMAERGLSPSFFVGGEVVVAGERTNARWGEGEWVVVEADESDRSFLKLAPEVAVVTNVELDHHHTYAGLDELLAAFREFCERSGTVVAWAGQKELTGLVPPGRRIVSYLVAGDAVGPAGGSDADLEAALTDAAGGAAFELHGDFPDAHGELQVRGRHNVQNALAAVAATREAGVEPADALAALATFAGVGRRFEELGRDARGARLFDDYAHHPTEVEAALRTAREAAGDGRVVAVFQPHLYSRTSSLARSFGRALALADEVCVLDVYPARELAEDFPGVSGYLVATAAADARPGLTVYWTPTRELARRALAGLLREDDVCMTIGAGDITSLGRELVAEAAP